MVWPPRRVPPYWRVPASGRKAFQERRFADLLAEAGPHTDAVFRVLIPSAGFMEDVDLVAAAAGYARDNGLLPPDEVALLKADGYGYAGRTAAQTKVLRRWLAHRHAPEDWLRAAWSAYDVGHHIHALGYASCGLRLSAYEPRVDNAVLNRLSLLRGMAHAGFSGRELADVFADPPGETLDARGRAFISTDLWGMPRLPCDDRPGLDDEMFRRSVALVRAGVGIGDGGSEPDDDGDEDLDALTVVAGFFPPGEFRAAARRWPDLGDHDDPAGYLGRFAGELHHLVVSQCDVVVVPLSMDHLERWLAAHGYAAPRRWMRDVYALRHAHLGRVWTGEADAMCWCGLDCAGRSCTHTAGRPARSVAPRVAHHRASLRSGSRLGAPRTAHPQCPERP